MTDEIGSLILGKEETKPPGQLQPNELARKIESEFKVKLGPASLTRTSDQQLDLIKRAAAGEKNIFMPAPIKAGKDVYHENAIDVPTTVSESWMNSHGYFRPFPQKDPVHYVLKPSSDDTGDLILGKQTVDQTLKLPTEVNKPVNQQPVLKQPVSPQTAFTGNPNLARQAIAARQSGTPGTNAMQNIPNVAQAVGENLTNPAFVAKDLAAAFDNTIGSVLPFFTKKLSQAGTRFLGADKAGEISDKLVSYVDKPLGRAFGITEDPVYQNQALSRIMNFIGENKEKGDEWIAKNTGMNKNDVQFFTDMALIKAGQEPTKVIKKPIEAVETIASSLQEALTEMKKPKDKTATVTLEGVNYQPSMVGVGAAKTEINPYKGFTGEDTISKGEFPQVKLSRVAKDVDKPEQAKIAQVVREILGEEGGVRPGVLSRNENTLRNEFAEAKMSNPTMRGQVLKEQIANEQNALYRYAEKRIDETGSNKNLLSDYERGQVLHDAMASQEGLRGFFKQEKQTLFDDAKAKVGDNPIVTTKVDDLLADKQFRASLGLGGNEGVAASAEQFIRLAKEVGFKDEFGVVHPANSISAFKAVREALNSQYNANNAKVIKKINKAIDEDMALAGGQELYKKADNMHEAEMTLFGSKGMKELFGEIDENGIQKGIPFDNMIKKLNQMPVDQFKHVFDTLSLLQNGLVKTKKFEIQVPKEIQDYAKAALAEIKGGLAREVYQAGAKNAGEWNKNAVNTVLNSRAEKIKHAFSPDEQRAFHTLNYGGHFMQPKHEYEGAGLQQRRVGVIAGNLPTALETVGALTGSTMATVAGRKAGEFGQSKIVGRSERKEAEKLQKEMKQNIKLSDMLKEK
tara:strand:- start:826 stop:3387 length:2562 start_codon:yes stop_codon:yes gene_type:complete